MHRYAGPESSNPDQWSNSYKGWQSQANGKLVFLEEWGVNTQQYNTADEFRSNSQDMNNAGLPWIYWMLLPSKRCDSGDSDPFPFYIDQGGVPVAEQVKGASNADSPQNWKGIVY